MCAGDPTAVGASPTAYRAIVVQSNALTFSYGGSTNLRTLSNISVINSAYAKGKMEVGSSGVTVSGTFIGNSTTLSGSFNVTGNITGSSSGSIVSDRNLKNTINQFTASYESLFDALQPVTYKYNDGTSGRLHSGFIAQDVLSAITSAGLTTQDLAAYIEATDDNGNIVRSLRYEEFIALNTWQIQKLKQRVSALEATIALLQNQ
jgi:hypothetical protein